MRFFKFGMTAAAAGLLLAAGAQAAEVGFTASVGEYDWSGDSFDGDDMSVTDLGGGQYHMVNVGGNDVTYIRLQLATPVALKDLSGVTYDVQYESADAWEGNSGTPYIVGP